MSSPARGVDSVLAGSFESIFNAVGTERLEFVELEPDEEGDLGENIWDEKGSVILAFLEKKNFFELNSSHLAPLPGEK